ncbi:hypothetical protein Cantr_05792 [Candida viswanathii]|uniref:Uncharacterized protein n=1 Tax=Candida viswanathii TaxID=5486 RepID=A0A367XS59_9ASCO|nr:hypothetical protein Cantr_05792 [Candida viswanathii]
MGCDRRLIPIISDITDLSFERFRNSVTETDYLALSEDMLRRLHEMKISMMDQITLESPWSRKRSASSSHAKSRDSPLSYTSSPA